MVMSDTFRGPRASISPTRQVHRCEACGFPAWRKSLASKGECSNNECEQNPEYATKKTELNEKPFPHREMTWRERDNKKRFHWHTERFETLIQGCSANFLVIKTYTFAAVSHVGARKFRIDLCAKEQVGDRLKEGTQTSQKVTVDLEATVTPGSDLLMQHLNEAQRAEVLAAVEKLRRKRKHGNSPHHFLNRESTSDRREATKCRRQHVEMRRNKDARDERRDRRKNCFRVNREAVYLRRVKLAEEYDRDTLYACYFFGLVWTRSDERDLQREEEMEMYTRMGGYHVFLEREQEDDCRYLGYDPDEEERLAARGHLPDEFDLEADYCVEIDAKNQEHAAQEQLVSNRYEQHSKPPRSSSLTHSLLNNEVSA